MKRRNVLALALACCLLLSLFAACGGEGQSSGGGSSSSSSERSSSSSSAEEPSSSETGGDAQEEPRVITILGAEGWAPHTDWTKVTDYGTYQQLQEWMKAKNIDIECEVVTGEQYSVVLQTRLASGQQLPDICKAHTMDNASLLAMAEQGTIVAIEDVFDKYSDGTAKKTIEETFPHVRPLITAADGHIYWVTNIQKKFLGDKVYDGNFGVLYRKDWTDKLNIATPTTLDEFTGMLRQFREQDANGDGQANEILAIDVSGFRTGIAQWFGLPAGYVALAPQEKKITSAWKSPNVGDYFAYISSLVAEGIVDPSASSGEANAQNRLSGKWDYPNVTWNEAGCAELAPDANFVALMPLPAVEGVEPGAMGEPGSLV